jgi:hypothetical protein
VVCECMPSFDRLLADDLRMHTGSETLSYTLSCDAGPMSSSLHPAPRTRSPRLPAGSAITSPCATSYRCALPQLTSVQTSLLRALAPTTPTYLFPAMNTLMYEHPLTAEHLRVVRDVIRYNVVGPIGKKLACGDIGIFPPFGMLSTC